MLAALVNAGLGRAWARQRYPRKPLFRLPGLPPDACIALDFEYALGGRQDMINPLFLQPKTIKLAYRLQTKRAVRAFTLFTGHYLSQCMFCIRECFLC